MEERDQGWYNRWQFEHQDYYDGEYQHWGHQSIDGRDNHERKTQTVAPQGATLSFSAEAMLAQILANQNEMIEGIRIEVAATKEGIKNLDKQVEQLASEQYAEEDAFQNSLSYDQCSNIGQVFQEECDPCHNEKNPAVPCHEEQARESSIIIPPSSIVREHELPFPQDRTLSSHVRNEWIEIKVLLPLNPPFSTQCFYDEVKDWKGAATRVHYFPLHLCKLQRLHPCTSHINQP